MIDRELPEEKQFELARELLHDTEDFNTLSMSDLDVCVGHLSSLLNDNDISIEDYTEAWKLRETVGDIWSKKYSEECEKNKPPSDLDIPDFIGISELLPRNCAEINAIDDKPTPGDLG